MIVSCGEAWGEARRCRVGLKMECVVMQKARLEGGQGAKEGGRWGEDLRGEDSLDDVVCYSVWTM